MRVTLIHNPGAGRQEHDAKALLKLLRRAGHKARYQSSDEKGWEAVLDKRSHGGWEGLAFAEAIARRQSTTLVVTGVETDVCVLAFAFGATDRGYRVVIVEDAVASSSPEGHRSALEAIYPRLDQQIQIATVAQVLAAWPAERRAE